MQARCLARMANSPASTNTTKSPALPPGLFICPDQAKQQQCPPHPASRSFDGVLERVDKVLPDYRERKEWLRMRGAELDI